MPDQTPVELSPEEELAAAFAAGIDESLPEIQVEATPEAPKEEQPKVEAPPAPATPTWQPREFTFKHNGKEVTFKPSSQEEEVTFFQKGYDYTQKTQALSEERKTLQQIAKELHQRETERQQSIRAFLSDPAKLRAVLNSLEGNAPSAGQQTPSDPNDDELEPLTKAEFKKLAEQLITTVKEEGSKTFEAQQEKAEIASLQRDYAADFDRTLSTLITDQFPILQDIEGVEQLIRADGHKAFKAQQVLDPYSAVNPQVVKDAMMESAKRRSEKLLSSQRLQEKKAAVERAALVTKGPEPSGGNAPPAPQAKQYKLNDKELDAQVVAEIMSMMK